MFDIRYLRKDGFGCHKPTFADTITEWCVGMGDEMYDWVNVFFP